MEWMNEEQVIWECIDTGLRGLKRLGWLESKEYEKISNELQTIITKRVKNK